MKETASQGMGGGATTVMKIVVLAILVLAVTGCTMDRAEVVAATKQCEEAGMQPVPILNGFHQVWDVQCYPKEKP